MNVREKSGKPGRPESVRVGKTRSIVQGHAAYMLLGKCP